MRNLRRESGGATHVHNAYRKPQKQNAAIIIKMRNCIIMARKLKTIRLFLSVTKASLHDVKHDNGLVRTDFTEGTLDMR